MPNPRDGIHHRIGNCWCGVNHNTEDRLGDVVAAMQQRNRNAVHSVKGVQASIQNEVVLSERRMRNGVALDAEALHRQMRHWALVLSLTVEGMQSDDG